MNKQYTSLELSRKLKEGGCELESEMYWNEYHKRSEGDKIFSELITKKMHNEMFYNENDIYSYDIANDILIRYAKDFFGDKIGNVNFGNDSIGDMIIEFKASHYIPLKILEMLQQGKPQEDIEKYILDNCLFNSVNKKIEAKNKKW